MNYYYDIYLNFNEKNLPFYEWESTDNIEYYKKLPIMQVDNQVLEDVFVNKIKVSKEIIEKFGTIFLLANPNGVIALEFDLEGNNITRSFLEVEDEINILEIIYTIPKETLTYEIIAKLDDSKNLRYCESVKRMINLEINDLIKKNDENKLKYLYLEWFLDKEQNVDKMILKMRKKLEEGIDYTELKIADIIKLSYNHV